MKNLFKITFVFIFAFSLLWGMSSKKSVHGELILTGNEPFTYFIIKCDDGQKFVLEGDKKKLNPLQSRRVRLTYMQKDKEKLFPVVKVIDIKLE